MKRRRQSDLAFYFEQESAATLTILKYMVWVEMNFALLRDDPSEQFQEGLMRCVIPPTKRPPEEAFGKDTSMYFVKRPLIEI